MRETLFSLLGIAGKCMGPRSIEIVGRALGAALWMMLPSRRRMASEAIQARLGKSPQEARRLARESFAHACRAFLEVLLRSRVDHRFAAQRVDVESPERIAAIRQDHGPRVVTTGHIGAWELGMPLSRLAMPEIACAAVARSAKNPALNDLTLHFRSRPGLQIIENRQGSLKAMRHLRKNGLVVFVADHNCMRNDATFIDFLGKKAAVHLGPAVLAVRSKATVWPVFVLRQPGGRYRLRVDEPLDTKKLEGSDTEKIETVARFYTTAVERVVREHPEQWFWMHKRWKTRPLEEAAD